MPLLITAFCIELKWHFVQETASTGMVSIISHKTSPSFVLCFSLRVPLPNFSPCPIHPPSPWLRVKARVNVVQQPAARRDFTCMCRAAQWYFVCVQKPQVLLSPACSPLIPLSSLGFSSETSPGFPLFARGFLELNHILRVCKVQAVIPLYEADSVSCVMTVTSTLETGVHTLLTTSTCFF